MARSTPNRNAILMACRVPDYRNLYVVGTLARRVSFATQQRRAFNLAQAIDADLKRSGDAKGLEGKNIAIIGASLAGMTASMSLSAFHANLFVYDGQPRHMAHLNDASHRHIHPTVNFWPREALEPSTAFPALNWFGDTCHAVQEQIAEDYRTLRSRDKRYASAFRDEQFGVKIASIQADDVGEPGREVQKFLLKSEVIESDGTVGEETISFESASGGRRHFDIVIIATGFGTDTLDAKPEGEGPHTYWDKDRDILSNDGSFDGYENLIITGTGDGGLIELVRFLFGECITYPFPAKIDNVLNDVNLKNRILNIESEAAKDYFDIMMHGTDRDQKGALNKLSERLAGEYKAAARFISTPNLDGLESLRLAQIANYEEAPLPPLKLVGITPSPYELGVAPIHKLLLAVADNLGWFDYVQVVRDDWDAPSQTEKRDAFKESYRPLPRDFNYLPVKNGRKQSKRKTIPSALIIERHGARRHLALLRDLEANRPAKREPLSDCIRRLQLMYSENDWIDDAAWSRFVTEFYGAGDAGVQGLAGHYIEIARDYFENVYGLGLYSPGNGQYVIYHEKAARPEDVINAARRKWPDRFFNVDIVPGLPPIDERPLEDA